MASISKDELYKEISAILAGANLAETSAKQVRLQLQKRFDCDLLARKKEIDDIVMDIVNNQIKEEEEEEAESSEDEEPVKKKPSPKAAKRKRNDSDSNDDEVDMPKRAAKKPATKRKVKTEVEGEEKKKRGGGKGFTRPYRLSPELSALMGEAELPRHAVVKKVWSIIKERNLYDPKNKQYAICDAELQKVMGIKRFRTFGMLKYLKKHFLD